MYAYLKGILVEANPIEVTLDVNGVGYLLHIPISEYGILPQVGENVLFYTTFVVRELSQALYGFLSKEGRDLFEELITISGVGPKLGLAIIGHLTLEQLQEAVRAHDPTALARVPGIGKKTAERLLIELQGKLKIKAFPQVSRQKGIMNDALQALIQLGYTQAAAEKAVKRAAETVTSEEDLSTLIKNALKCN